MASSPTPAPAGRFIKGPKDFWAGCIYIALAAAAIGIARNYAMGTAVRMGPAYFPTLLGWLLAVVGGLSLVRAFIVRGEPLPVFAWRELAIVVGAVVIFSILAERAGLVPALVVLVLMSMKASKRFNIRTAALLAIAVAGFCYLVFTRGLELNLPAFGPWLGF